MSPKDHGAPSRRRVLQMLAAMPLAAEARASAQGLPQRPPDPMVWAPRDPSYVISDPKQALDVFDFEPVAKQNLPPAHFGYMVTGADDEITLRANREGFLKLQLRPRRLVDVASVDMSVELFGDRYDSPIAIAPTGSNRAFHPEAEAAVARAAKTANHLQMLSTGASTSIEDAIAARGAPVWFQLYPTDKWEVTTALIARAERAGAPAIALTVDTPGAANWQTLARLRRADTRKCGDCHDWHGLAGYVARRPNFAGIDLAGATSLSTPRMDWDFVKRLRDTVKVKLLLKGIMAHEDAVLAATAGIDAIIVSNHGGRVGDLSRATIDALPEIVEAVGDRMPVLVDSGFRRGTDIVKALALGARAVCIGRPSLWGLAAFGQAGVERVLEILRDELRSAMQQLGAPRLRDITPAMVRRA